MTEAPTTATSDEARWWSDPAEESQYRFWTDPEFHARCVVADRHTQRDSEQRLGRPLTASERDISRYVAALALVLAEKPIGEVVGRGSADA